MKKKKIISIFLVIITLLGIGLPTPVSAGNTLEEAMRKENLFAEGTARQLLRWNGLTLSDFAPQMVFYQKDGVKMPAYCFQPNREGVEERGTITVDCDTEVGGETIWGVVANGWPYKTPAELGVNSDYEAYYVTKMALWACTWSNYSNVNDWTANGSQNDHVLTAFKNLVAKGRAATEIPTPTLTAAASPSIAAPDDLDSNMLSQTFTVTSSAGVVQYAVSFAGTPPPGGKITNTSNVEQTLFQAGEQFKVLIPKTGTDRSGTYELYMTAQTEQRVVLWGKSHNDNVQDYIVTTLDPVPTSGSATGSFKETDGGKETGKLTIYKVDAGTRNGLAGAIFRVTHSTEGILGDFISDTNGQITVPVDKLGVHYIEELVPPTGYVLSENSHKDVVIRAEEPAVVTFENKPEAQLELKKIDATTGESIKDAVFRIALDGGTDFTDIQTDASGTARISGLKEGTYSIVEISVNSKYILDPAPQYIKLSPGDKKTIVIENQQKPGILICKYDEDTGYPLENAEFSVKIKGGTIIYEGMTDKSGQIKLEGLEAGLWYEISELAPPPGYLPLNETKDVYLEPNTVVQVKFDNRLRPSLQLMKIDAETKEPLAGAVFVVRKTEDATESEYITGEDGCVIIHDLDEAIYTVFERSAPEGYLLDEQHKDIKLEWGKTKTLIFENTEKPKLEILKQDTRTGEPIPGTRFLVTKLEDKTVSEYTTDESGRILIENLDEAIYQVEEISVPDTHILEANRREIALEGGMTKTLVYENIRKPTLIITKTNGLTLKPIPNATFKIEYEAENGGVVPVGTYKTNEKGQIVLPRVAVGWYRITETIPAPGFSLPTNPTTRKYLAAGENAYSDVDGGNGSDNGSGTGGGASGDILVTSGYDYDLGEEIVNWPLNSIVIKKVNANTKELLGGAVFEVRKVTEDISGSSGTTIGRYTGNGSGIIVLTGLEPGGYIVEEVSPPSNFTLAELSTQQVWMKYDGTSIVEITFENYPYGSVLVTKVDASNNKPLAGARFKVADASGQLIGANKYVTDENGEFLVENIKPGTSVIVTEIEAPEGFKIDTTPQTVLIGTEGKTHTLSFKNQPIGTLVIRKWNSADNTPLAGAEFLVKTSKGDVIGENNGLYRTDEKGTIIIPEVEGTLVVQEVKAPDGFVLEQQTQTVVVEYAKTHTLDFYNRPQSGLIVYKFDQNNQPLAGATFRLIKKSGEVVEEFVVPQNGYVIDNLEPGHYSCFEIASPEGYILNSTPQEFEITSNQLVTLDFYNRLKASLIIKKTDALTQAPLSGVLFVVEKQTGEIVGEFETDVDGTINVSSLTPGWYVVREKRTLDTHILDETPKTVEVKANVPTVVNFTNKPRSGLQIKKIDSVTKHPIANVEFNVSRMSGERIGTYKTDAAGLIFIPNLESGWYTVQETRTGENYIIDTEPINIEIKWGEPAFLEVENDPKPALTIKKVDQKGNPLEGVRFEVNKENGERLGFFTTDRRGRIYISDDILTEGKYLVTEVEALKGYELDPNPKEVTIRYGKSVTVEFVNKELAGLRIKKIDSVTKEPIYNVEFRLYDFETNKEIGGPYYSDNNGVVDFTGILTEGRYKILETRPADGYVRDDIPKTVEFKNGKVTEIVWENTPLKGQIVITKRSADFNPVTGLPAGSPLSGASFEVYNTSGNLVAKMVSDEKGVAACTLPTGVYFIKEVSPPKYYALNPKELWAEIRHDGDIVRFEFLNQSISLDLTIDKKGPNQIAPGQDIVYEMYNIGNKSSVTLENFYIHDRIPSDAARVTKVVTGTYSERLTYRLTYKTNYHDYRVLAENLSTKNSYEYSLHPNALGLAAGEYVTDIRLEFPQASPGFRSEQNMFVFCQVLPTIPKDYKVINRADVGGHYYNEWESKNTSWTTIVWKQDAPAVALPRTGY